MSATPQEWPALMDLATASQYLSLSPGSLVAYLRRNGVEPVDLGLRLRRWRRRDLDDLVGRTPLLGSAGLPHVSTDLGGEALAAVERRTFARGGRSRRASP